MAILEQSTPPGLLDAHYEDYREWIEGDFFKRICAYCLLKHERIEIDHYEPKKYAPNRVNDPSNLLPACGRCNGRGGKSDYHPRHDGRTRMPKDRSGFHVLDVRYESLGGLMTINGDGSLRPRPGRDFERTVWNIALLKLDLEFLDQERERLIRKTRLCERLLAAKPRTERDEQIRQQTLALLTDEVADQYLLLLAFDVEMLPAFEQHLLARRNELCVP